jgi:16S rRNA C967 or C1407 C5-methylase (RsmB/RsmF family)
MIRSSPTNGRDYLLIIGSSGPVVLLCSQPKINFVNAVLRRLSEDGTETLQSTSVLDNVHPWLANQWIEFYGEATARTIVNAAMAPSPIFVSVNPLYRKETSNPTQTVLQAFAWGTTDVHTDNYASPSDEILEPELLPIGCIRVPGHFGGTVSKWPLYDQGAWWVQDPSATLPAIALWNGLNTKTVRLNTSSTTTLVEDMHVVDLCSAPGGKTAQLCSLGFHQKIDAVEVSKARTKLLHQNLQRLCLQDKCNVHVEDGRRWLPRGGDAAVGGCSNVVDGVLLDVPCSATGLGSRRPDVLTKVLFEDNALEPLLVTQRELMAHAVDDLLKEGGLMVYSTCSLLKQEGEDQLEWLLKRGSKDGGGDVMGGTEVDGESGIVGTAATAISSVAAIVETLPFEIGEFPGFDDCITEQGWLRVLPGVLKGSLQYCDGFFVARVVKIGCDQQ